MSILAYNEGSISKIKKTYSFLEKDEFEIKIKCNSNIVYYRINESDP